MRWIKSRKTKRLPAVGETRLVYGFLWFPKTISGETRWLECASWLEEFYEGWDYDSAYSGWRLDRWVDDIGSVLKNHEELIASIRDRDAELLRVRTKCHGAAHALDNIATEAGLEDKSPLAVQDYVRGLRKQIEVLCRTPYDQRQT